VMYLSLLFLIMTLFRDTTFSNFELLRNDPAVYSVSLKYLSVPGLFAFFFSEAVAKALGGLSAIQHVFIDGARSIGPHGFQLVTVLGLTTAGLVPLGFLLTEGANTETIHSCWPHCEILACCPSMFMQTLKLVNYYYYYYYIIILLLLLLLLLFVIINIIIIIIIFFCIYFEIYQQYGKLHILFGVPLVSWDVHSISCRHVCENFAR